MCCFLGRQRRALHLLYLASEHGEAHSQQRHCCSPPHSMVPGHSGTCLPTQARSCAGLALGAIEEEQDEECASQDASSNGAGQEGEGPFGL